MKEFAIIIIILMIIFGTAFYIERFLNNTSDKLVSKLENLKADIETKNIGEERIREQANQIYGEWQEVSEKWSIIVLHDEIDLIQTSLIRIKSKIETKKFDESIEDLDTSIFLLKHIKEKEKTSLKNIF